MKKIDLQTWKRREHYEFFSRMKSPYLGITANTSILHPTNFTENESVPKIAFGKFSEQNGEKWMPVSIEAHHGLVDGIHIHHYFEKFESLLKE